MKVLTLVAVLVAIDKAKKKKAIAVLMTICMLKDTLWLSQYYSTNLF